MCGICGFANPVFQKEIHRQLLKRMTELLRHRGPDSEGVFLAQGIALGVRRLSIIDLKTGDQPIASENGEIQVVCNGEIYNHLDLRRELTGRGHRFRTYSDTEVIVHLYEDLGTGCLKRLRGMFAFALWDGKNRRLMLARDRLGIKPLHYLMRKEGLYFGSEYKCFLALDDLERRIDFHAVRDLFTIGFVAGERTLMAGVKRLRPGHFLIWDEDSHVVSSYWEPPFSVSADPCLSPKDWVEGFREKLIDSVRSHLQSDVEVGAWLSSGVDSSAIAALISRLQGHPLKTFTLGFEEPDYDETRNCSLLSDWKQYNLQPLRVICRNEDFRNYPRAVWHCEDPFTAGLEIARLRLSEATAASVKVVLTGEGADEVLGGYPWYQVDKVLRPLSRLPLSWRRLMISIPGMTQRFPRACQVLEASAEMNLDRYCRLIGAPLGWKWKEKLWREKEEAASLPIPLPSQFFAWHPFEQLQFWDLTLRLPDCVVHHLDRGSMAYSLETRVPFLDHELVEWCARVPPSMKLKGITEKYLLRKAMAGILPRNLAWRGKRGLSTPYNKWLCADLPEFAREMFSESALQNRGYFDPLLVQKLLAQHRQGAQSVGRILLGVLGIQLWDEFFIRNRRPG
jgi:asparagine synthase (glutamine-hydrolysing)